MTLERELQYLYLINLLNIFEKIHLIDMSTNLGGASWVYLWRTDFFFVCVCVVHVQIGTDCFEFKGWIGEKVNHGDHSIRLGIPKLYHSDSDEQDFIRNLQISWLVYTIYIYFLCCTRSAS